MEVLILSWEYPPQMVGGLGQHVFELSRHLVDLGVHPHVLTPGVKGCPEKEEMDGVVVHRVGRAYTPELSFKTWIMSFNSDMVREGVRICRSLEDLAVIHAHDWLVAHGARALARIFSVPLLATIHATEYGRNQGLHNRNQMEIHEIEKNLALDATRVICCSQHMKREVTSLFAVDPAKVAIIPNGVTQMSPEVPEKSDDNMIFFIGRLVPEKGAQVLIDAMPEVCRAVPDARLVVGGRGPIKAELATRVEELGLSSRVTLAGYVGDDQKADLYRQASVAAFPSLYEPFGIVALEAMAAGTPVIVSDVGGLSEIVADGVTGLKVPPGDSGSLAAAIIRILQSPALGRKLALAALTEIETSYTWDRVARLTWEQYQRIAPAARKVKVV